MKKIERISLVLILFSLLSVSYLVTSASAQIGMPPGMNGGQCDPNPACVENCCGQCDPNPACVENCCPRGPNDHGGPNDHHNGPNDHGDPCMNMPPGPAQADCYRHKDDHRGPPGGEDCEAMGMKDGSPHVDPPQNILDQVKAEYEANCKNGNCFLGEGNYKLLEDMGHMRAKVDCFLKEGERRHNDQHGGPGHNSCASIPDPANRAECEKHSGPNDHHGGPNDHRGPN